MADIRTLRVKGRITNLTSSINTIKNLNAKGQPMGVICIIKLLKKWIVENKTQENHIMVLQKNNKLIWEFSEKEKEFKFIILIIASLVNNKTKKFTDILDLFLLFKFSFMKLLTIFSNL